GVGDTTDRSLPTITPGGGWSMVSVGGSHACGLMLDGTRYCWVKNAYSQLGLAGPGPARRRCRGRRHSFVTDLASGSAYGRPTSIRRWQEMTEPERARNGLTVLLVHGAFADASSWSAVVAQLMAAGLDVQAVANPLRGLAADARYLADLASAAPGRVLLV